MIEFLFTVLLSVLPPCATEELDGTCAWDAANRGDTVGTSYVVLDGTQWIDPR